MLLTNIAVLTQLLLRRVQMLKLESLGNVESVVLRDTQLHFFLLKFSSRLRMKSAGCASNNTIENT